MTTNTLDKFATRPILKVLRDSNLSLVEKQLAFLEDTVNYYRQNPAAKRSLNHWDSCVYRDETGTRACAIGRFLTEFQVSKIKKLKYSTKIVHFLANENLVPAQIKILGLKFLTSVQDFHDNNDHWYEDGLSGQGETVYASIKSRILEEDYIT